MTSRCDDTRRVLGYCRAALDEIKEEESTGATWERRWASLMALLRTSCETLKREAPDWRGKQMKIPNKQPKGKNGCHDRKNAREPDIYEQFIRSDANLFLHEGKLTTGQSITVFVGAGSLQLLAAGEHPRPMPTPNPPRKAEIGYHMNDGPYTGCDPRDVADKAISWLQEQIEGAEG